jgi:hypothetical protein
VHTPKSDIEMNPTGMVYEGTEWIILSQNMIQWQIVLNTMPNLRVL